VAESSSALGGQANERELLTGYLDWYRSVVEGKVADLALPDASRTMTPTGLSFYRESTEHSRRVVAAASLDDASVGESPFYGHVSLRWILVHMLEETARHAGHLDLMREQIDGRTGD
jgi:hypothetical protein